MSEDDIKWRDEELARAAATYALLKERDELLEEMANKSQESIEMMKFAERHGDVVGFRIWQKLHEVITDLLTRYSNLKAK